MRSNAEVLVFTFLKGVDTPRALGLYLRFKYGGYAAMLEAKMKPGDYADAESFHKDYIAFSFFKKIKTFRTEKARDAAVANFTRSEHNCRLVNEYLKSLSAGTCESRYRNLEAKLFAMRGYISKVLGRSPMASMRDCKWTTGANDDLKKSQSRPDKKLEAPLSVTRRASSFIGRELACDPHWFWSQTGLMPEGPYSPLLKTFLKIVEGGRYDTVPKTSVIDRSIIVEPRGNSFLQKSVGTFIRRRLLRAGVNLNDQGINQRLAQKAFRENLATIDLEMASDSIADELVHILLPVDWYNLLSDLRSPKVSLDGSFHKLEKFSSMGNGFTFELESLIFAAAAYAVTSETKHGYAFSVYGDDIIVHQSSAGELVSLLEALGFTVNTEKSFVTGMFYESCGKHYFGDHDVTPIYQKEDFDDVEAIRSFNRVYRLCSRCPSLTANFASYMSLLARLYPRYLESTVAPDFYSGDDAKLVPTDSLEFDRNYGYRSRRIRELSKEFPGHEPSMLAYTLRQSLSQDSATYGNVRSKRVGYVLSAFYVNKFG